MYQLRPRLPFFLLFTLLCTCVLAQNEHALVRPEYEALPLGAIQPRGWLKENLERMATGLTGNLDHIYPEVVGDRNGWLGGDGDGWERGPYWIDGLLPLAYLLDNDTLKAKAQRWVDWTLENQRADGYLGPIPFTEDPGHIEGLQRTQRRDWWPKMVMLKVLQQYYGATGDERVLTALTNYFRFQLRELPGRPLDADTFWGNRRGADNIQVVHWLYRITGDDFLLELSDLLAEQTFPWDRVFTNDVAGIRNRAPWSYGGVNYPFDSAAVADMTLADQGSIHCVNLAQGLKQPAMRYESTGEEKYLHALQKALVDIRKYHGQVSGMFGGDEPLHGTDPGRGIEFCAISEELFSLETIQQLTGDVAVGDLLERIAFNALPTQTDDWFTRRQYFQASNQIELRQHAGYSFEGNNHNGTDFVYGIKTGYVCCTTNMHQSWPKFVQNLFYKTPDGGVAALQYGPAVATFQVGEDAGAELRIEAKTGYPFRERISFGLSLSESATFPFHLRIPGWTDGARILVNGEAQPAPEPGTIAVLNRTWTDGDTVKLLLPMPLRTSTWHDFSRAIERGPLVFAHAIRGREVMKVDTFYGPYTEVYADEAWNYGLIAGELRDLEANVEVIEKDWDGRYPWVEDRPPVSLRLKGLLVPEWTAANGVPHLPASWGRYTNWTPDRIGEIELIPYGATVLRISAFPVFDLRERTR